MENNNTWMLVTAHPDDESMFFIPTLRNLIVLNQKNDTVKSKSDTSSSFIQVLCLSNGDYRHVSDGPIRTKEMHNACSFIGIIQNNKNNEQQPAGAVTVINDERMKDGPNEVWNTDLVAQTVLDHICKTIPSMACVEDSTTSRKNPNRKHDYLISGPDINNENKEQQYSWEYMDGKDTHQPSLTLCKPKTINLNLLTFDRGGVSNHPNHVDVFKGIQYLLNEKCHISSSSMPEQEEPMATLQLCSKSSTNGKTTASGGRKNVIIELNLSVYTLRTISNPLYKYFLWAFVDIIPYIFICTFQVVIYLIYFLLGGLIWGNNKAPKIQPFTGGMKISNDRSRSVIQYRIMDPILVWKAMAAHYSQFVWYRRLSVLFSRYTYINDIEKMSINPPFANDEDDRDDIASLPPVTVIEEEEDSTSSKFLISHVQMNAIRGALLPPGLHHRPWKRIYSLSRDGDSFVAFRKLLEDWYKQSKGNHSSILVVKTTAGDVIGGYASVPIVPLSSTLESAAGSCLFKVVNANDDDNADPVVEVYGKDCGITSTKKIIFDATKERIAFGGGYIDGSDEGFGLCLDTNFARGTTSLCAAFQSEALISSQDGVFDVLDMEIWGFVFGQF